MAEQVSADLMSRVVALCKRRGIIFQSSDIYGGINGFWDYGPNGVPLRRSVEQSWWRYMVEDRDNVVGLDSTIICHPEVWRASGHVDQFSDSMTDCLECKKRYRVDQLEIGCLVMGSTRLTEPREFNLMMKTYVVGLDEEQLCISARKLPAVLSISTLCALPPVRNCPSASRRPGKPSAEINPASSPSQPNYADGNDFSAVTKGRWTGSSTGARTLEFYTQVLGIPKTTSVCTGMKSWRTTPGGSGYRVRIPFGWGEIEGIHHRGTWDMSRHCEFSYQEQDCKVFDQDSKESFFPTVIETSCGLDRICLMLLCNGYDEDTAETKKADKDEDTRVVLHLPPRVAPVQVAILPLSKKLEEMARPLVKNLRRCFRTDYDDSGSIGKRYRRQDEIGTPFCVTVDFDSVNDQAVTVRDRDSMSQERMEISKLAAYLMEKI